MTKNEIVKSFIKIVKDNCYDENFVLCNDEAISMLLELEKVGILKLPKETKFNPGDKVMCIENTSYFLHPNTEYGKIYTVKDVLFVDENTTHITLTEMDGKFNDYKEDKFELVVE